MSPSRRRPSLLVDAAAGATAGAVARSVTAPLDRVKILYQIDPSRSFSMQRALKSGVTIWRNTGARGLWRGNTAAVIRIAPYSAIAFTTYPQFEMLFRTLTGIGGLSRKHDSGNVAMAGVIRFWSGAGAGTVATLATYPLDLLRARVAAHWGVEPKYASYTSALREIVRTEGAGALFNGLRPTLVGIVPYAGLSFMTYETLKSWACRRWGYEHAGELPTASRLVMGAVAGLVAQTSTYPLHVIRRRMQVGVTAMKNSQPPAGTTVQRTQSAGGAPGGTVVAKSFGRMGLAEALTEVASREGIAGLFKGVMLTWIKGPIAVALSFTLNDSLRALIVASRGEGAVGVDAASAADERYRPYRERVGLGRGHDWGGVTKAAGGEPNGDAAEEHEHTLAAVDLDTHGRRGGRKETDPFNIRRAGETLLAGSVAGGIAKTIIAPGDRVKILFQVNADRTFSLGRALRTGRTIVTNSGVLGLWRGNGAVLLRVVPYSGLTYLCFSFYERRLLRVAADADAAGKRSRRADETIRVFSRFCAGAAAGATATMVTYPLDLLRARMAAHWGVETRYPSYRDALREIVRTEGAGSLFNGLKPTLIGIVPYAGLSFCLFETMKAWAQRSWLLRHETDIPTLLRLALGALAGLIAQSAT